MERGNALARVNGVWMKKHKTGTGQAAGFLRRPLK